MALTGSAPAKAILFGEHAVVYGYPAIALPLPDLRAYAEYQSSDQPLSITSDHKPPPSISSSPAVADLSDPLGAMARHTLRYFGICQARGRIHIRSHIPVASGLGSGAAVSAALGRAIAAMLGRELAKADLNALVYEVEKLHHGSPSGIDNSVVVYEKPVYFQKECRLDFLAIPTPLHLVVADTGLAALTRETVAHVRQLRANQPETANAILRQIGSIAERARSHLESGEARRLGDLMARNHRLLQALELSSPVLDRLFGAALSAGALGAKLSGGGRGGNIIALVDESTSANVERALWLAGAQQVFKSTLYGKATSP